MSKKVKSDILICGNLLCTGEHHFQFDEQEISPKIRQNLLDQAITQICEKANRKLSPFVLFKDLDPKRAGWRKHFQEKYVEFEIQPNMILDIEWSDFDVYLAAMTTKYRTRVKRAQKKLGKIEKRHLSLEELAQYKEQMYALYKSVATNVGFNMVDLNPNYMEGLQKALPEDFSAYGYLKVIKC